MPKKKNSDLKVGATVHLRAQSGEIVEGHVVHLWEEKSVLMVRVASGDLVYNVPLSMLFDICIAKKQVLEGRSIFNDVPSEISSVVAKLRPVRLGDRLP